MPADRLARNNSLLHSTMTDDDVLEVLSNSLQNSSPIQRNQMIRNMANIISSSLADPTSDSQDARGLHNISPIAPATEQLRQDSRRRDSEHSSSSGSESSENYITRMIVHELDGQRQDPGTSIQGELSSTSGLWKHAIMESYVTSMSINSRPQNIDTMIHRCCMTSALIYLINGGRFTENLRHQWARKSPGTVVSQVLSNLLKIETVTHLIGGLKYFLILETLTNPSDALSQILQEDANGADVVQKISTILSCLTTEFPQLAETLQHTLRGINRHQKVPLGVVLCTSLPADNSFGATVVRNIKELVEGIDGTTTVDLAESLFVAFAADFDMSGELFIEQIKQWEVEGNLMKLSGALMYLPEQQCYLTIKVTENDYSLIGEGGAKLAFPEAQFQNAIASKEIIVGGISKSPVHLKMLHYCKNIRE